MSQTTRLAAATLLTLTPTLLLAQAAVPAYDLPTNLPVRARHALVVTIHHDATDAGLAILHQGGNAVDAAVAVAFALAVVYPAAGNLGGGGFLLYRPHHGRAHFIDYREKAPAAATRDMYLDPQGNVIPGLSTEGYKSSGVPGTVAGLTYAQAHFGRLTLEADIAPAIRLATEGFVLTEQEARNLHTDSLSRFPPPPTSLSVTATSTPLATASSNPSSPPLSAASPPTPPASTTAPSRRRSPPTSKPMAASSPPPTSPPTK